MCDIKEKEVLAIPAHVQICAVTKNRSLDEVAGLLNKYPRIKIIAENRWPDCQEKFEYFGRLGYKCHFIGPLQTNKVRKVLPLVDALQSVNSFALLEKMQIVAKELNKKIDWFLQINIAADPKKFGLSADEAVPFLEKVKAYNFSNLHFAGLMTILPKCSNKDRLTYFGKMEKLYDSVAKKHFKNLELTNLSMGMSEDYIEAINSGSTMVRLGRILFNN